MKVAAVQGRNRKGERLYVIQHEHGVETGPAAELGLGEGPGGIGKAHALVDHGPGNGDGSLCRRIVKPIEIRAHRLDQRGMSRALKLLDAGQSEGLEVCYGEPRVGAADIGNQ